MSHSPLPEQTPSPKIPQQAEISLENESMPSRAAAPARGSSPFSSVKAAAPDQILDLKQLFLRDPRPEKIDLSAGVYHDGTGANTVMAVVEKAERTIAERHAALPERPADYAPIEGLAEFNDAVTTLLYNGAPALAEGRVATLQAVGGTSALRYAADFLSRFFPDATVYLSDPSWGNHRTIFERAGLKVDTYPYYDRAGHALDFDAMAQKLVSIPPHSVVLLQGCCHNPSGADPTPAQWDTLVSLFKASEIIPIIDLAYHGFGSGVQEDVQTLGKLADSGISHFVACSFSKNFSLYNRRIGSLSFVGATAEETSNVFSQIKTEIRANNSNPPRDGAEIVSTILSSPELRSDWEKELGGMRGRIAEVREKFVTAMEARGLGDQFSHMRSERGMFSLTGLTPREIGELRDSHGIYMLDNGRICFACLNDGNMERVADALTDTLAKRVADTKAS